MDCAEVVRLRLRILPNPATSETPVAGYLRQTAYRCCCRPLHHKNTAVRSKSVDQIQSGVYEDWGHGAGVRTILGGATRLPFMSLARSIRPRHGAGTNYAKPETTDTAFFRFGFTAAQTFRRIQR